jgi:chromosome segregation ATPase
MSNNELDKSVEITKPSKGHAIAVGILGAGLVVALAGDGYLLHQSSELKQDLAQMQDGTQSQISKLGESTKTLLQERLQAIDEQLKSTQGAADTAVKRARTDALKQSKELTQRLEEQQKAVAGEITELKDATTTANSKISDVSNDVTGVKTDVTGVKADVATTQTELEKTGAELKRAIGDMGVMSGLIATNSKDLNALRELGERNYYEFDLKKSSLTQKVGNVTLTLKKSDPKRNRYTVEVMADDKRVEKRDKTVNEPVQLYVSDNRQPYEIVVNQIRKDEVVGYLSTPKVKIARR